MAVSSPALERPIAATLDRLAARRALKLFHEAAIRVPAYKDFLRKAKVRPELVRTPADLAQVPPTDKPNYISAYPLAALNWDGTLERTKFISSSSGSTGTPYYWPRGEEQNLINGEIFRRAYEQLFETKKGTTLFVDLFALGPWIAGLEFYNAAKYTADCGSALSVVTPSFEKASALDTIKRLGRSFDRIILAGYPPFVKDVLESGMAEGINWRNYDVRLFTAGESFSELWRDRVLSYLGRTDSRARIINLYGMAETGVVGYETPLSVALRRASLETPALAPELQFEGTPAALYQYDPTVRYLERGADDTLILTARAGLPLVRYNTRDQGGLLAHEEALALLKQARVPKDRALAHWQLPLVYLHGRRDLSLSFYALNIYVENLKYCLERSPLAKNFSGLFSMRVGHSEALDQRFEVVVELSHGARPGRRDAQELAAHIVRTLCHINSEYAKLYAALGQRAQPAVELVPYGGLDTMPGRKHRWVKKS